MRARIWPAVLTALLAIYVSMVATRGIALLRSGEPAGVVLGAAVVLFPAMVIWFVVMEWRLALRVEKMAVELAAADDLPFGAVPVSDSGRLPEGVVDSEFARLKALVEADPDNWRNWYHVAFVYNGAGDRAQARRSLRTAAKLWSKGRG